jgi:predicted 2-oxoglutarate/Fe(II)-dependent dioxygenase YbiX
LPGYRYFWDIDREVSRRYGVQANNQYRPCSVVLDASLRVLEVLPFDSGLTPEQHVTSVLRVIADEAAFVAATYESLATPVLTVPRVFEPAFCRELIDYYRQGQAEQSGFMRERDGKTVMVFDDEFKRRHDCSVVDEGLRLACRGRLTNRLMPEVFKAFQFAATYAERYIVSCYSASERGFFRPHRDNTTKGTAHRRFAVTINLNTGEYEGGRLRFPEYGARTFEAPLGGAIVFSCSLLHEATPVTVGERYAFLPFLYDEAGARIREANMPFVETDDAVASREGDA